MLRRIPPPRAARHENMTAHQGRSLRLAHVFGLGPCAAGSARRRARGTGCAGPPPLPHLLRGLWATTPAFHSGSLPPSPSAQGCAAWSASGRAAWHSGGSPSCWQRGRPVIGASGVKRFLVLEVVLVFKNGAITGKRLSRATRPRFRVVRGPLRTERTRHARRPRLRWPAAIRWDGWSQPVPQIGGQSRATRSGRAAKPAGRWSTSPPRAWIRAAWSSVNA